MEFDHSKFEGKIKEICKTKQNFGKQMGWSHTTTTKKISAPGSLTQEEIQRAVRILKIDVDEIPSYFFCPKSLEN